MKYINKATKFTPDNFENIERQYISEDRTKYKKNKIFFQILSILVATLLVLLLIYQVQKMVLNETILETKPHFVLPEPMVGLCNGTCVPNEAYPCIYSTFYPVSFTHDGRWRWDCPFVDKPGVEIGVGNVIGMPSIFQDTNNNWNVTWYGGNNIISDPKERIHCACYYLGGKFTERSWLFYSFQIKIIKSARNESIEGACGDFTGCPETIEDALEQLDSDPYIEQYFGCEHN